MNWKKNIGIILMFASLLFLMREGYTLVQLSSISTGQIKDSYEKALHINKQNAHYSPNFFTEMKIATMASSAIGLLFAVVIGVGGILLYRRGITKRIV